MQGKGISLRLGLLALVVVLVLSAVGSLSLAKDAFDGNDYDDCPAATRLDAVDGLAVDRTDEEDEIRISWDALSDAALSSLGANGYKARLTIIVEGSDDDIKNNVALGDTNLVVDDVTFTTDLTISVAITLGDFVISDIAEKDFTSGMPAPSFSTPLIEAGNTEGYTAGSHTQKFYYLGFNDLFDNWFVGRRPTVEEEDLAFSTSPATAKFRVGLAHGEGNAKPGDADFENYRIVIEDSSGDLLGYQAQTVGASATYGDNKIVFGGAIATPLLAADLTTTVEGQPDADPPVAGTVTYKRFSNIRLSNQVTGDSGALSPYYAAEIAGEGVDGDGIAAPDEGRLGLSYANVAEAPIDGALYVEPPVEYFDFPNDVFEDDGRYVIKAWAEDDDGTRISPVASIEISAREGDPVTPSRYEGYVVTRDADSGAVTEVADARSWSDSADTTELRLNVHGFSIQDE